MIEELLRMSIGTKEEDAQILDSLFHMFREIPIEGPLSVDVRRGVKAARDGKVKKALHYLQSS